jgi:hypothetical protein
MSKWYFCLACDSRVHISELQRNEGYCDLCAEKRKTQERQREQEAAHEAHHRD